MIATRSRLDARRRRGYSLVEVVLIVGSVAMILTLCGMFLHMLLKLDRSGRDAIADAGSVARLARQFRRDVRAAAVVKVVPPGASAVGGVDLTAPERPAIAYRAEGQRVVRTETEGTAVTRRESYPLAQFGAAAFQSEGPRVWLTLARPGDATGPSLRPGCRVEAWLGKDRQLASREEAHK